MSGHNPAPQNGQKLVLRDLTSDFVVAQSDMDMVVEDAYELILVEQSERTGDQRTTVLHRNKDGDWYADGVFRPFASIHDYAPWSVKCRSRVLLGVLAWVPKIDA